MLIPTDAQLADLSGSLASYAPARPYVDDLAWVAFARCPDGLDATRFAWSLAAIGHQESGWGHLLSPPLFLGRGDFAARTGGWLRRPGVQVVQALPKGWTSSRPGPWAIPEDGGGWGWYALQFDWVANRDWLLAHPAPSPRMVIDYGAIQWADMLVETSGVEVQAAEAYNEGIARVDADLKAGLDPDSTTTGADYGKRFSEFMQQFCPEGAQ